MKRILILIIFLAITQAAYAGTVLSIDLTVYRNDTVTENSIKITEGNPTFYNMPGEYNMVVKNINSTVIANESFHLDFEMHTNPSRNMTYDPVMQRIEYSQDMDSIELYHKNKIIFATTINACDIDDVCDPHETYHSCPQDCPLSQIDQTCTPKQDGICDPDCKQNYDPDCVKLPNTNNQMQPTINNLTIALELTIILILILTIVHYHNKTKKR